MLFAASMAWANVADAEQPCGAPIDTFESCQIVEAPDCHDVCGTDAMVVACVADNADQCMSECAGPDSIACAAACEQQCGNSCAAELVQQAPPQCEISCGASCMGECGAGCEVSDDKTTCFAACNQQCDAHCDVSCNGKSDVRDAGLDVDYDDAQALVQQAPQTCEVSCGSVCMGECGSGCQASQDKTTCFAGCSQECGAYCGVSCKAEPDVRETGLDVDHGGAQELVQQAPPQCEISCGASCMGECGAGCQVSDDKTACFAGCNQQCDASCELTCNGKGDVRETGLDVDYGDAQELVQQAPQQCEISCGASCMGECGAGCEVSDDKTTCFAACNQQCDASCEVSCNGKGDVHDNDLELSFADYQEGNAWDDYYKKCKKKHNRDWKKKCKSRSKWKKDEHNKCKKKYKRDWKKKCKKWESQQSLGLDVTRDCQLNCQQSCIGACEAGDARACELDCQLERQRVCAPQMTNSCADECNRGSVLLCDGQYLAVSDVDACVAALEHEGIAVEGPATELNTNELVGEALQGASCSIDEPNKRRLAGGLLALLGLGLGAGFLRRRRS